MKLKNINSEDDVKFLYELLKERPTHINISHKTMPTYQQHKVFVKSHPYPFWFIIYKGNERVGMVYKTKSDEVGIFIKKTFQGQHIGSYAVKRMCNKSSRSLANISPTNLVSINFFKKLGFKHIQNTYEYIEEKK